MIPARHQQDGQHPDHRDEHHQAQDGNALGKGVQAGQVDHGRITR
jgi:hypothetical protein